MVKVAQFWVKKITLLETLLLGCDFYISCQIASFQISMNFKIREQIYHSRNRHLNLRRWSKIRPFIGGPFDLIKQHQSFGPDCVMRPGMINHGPMSIDSLNYRTVSWPFHWFLVLRTLREKNWLIDFFVWSKQRRWSGHTHRIAFIRIPTTAVEQIVIKILINDPRRFNDTTFKSKRIPDKENLSADDFSSVWCQLNCVNLCWLPNCIAVSFINQETFIMAILEICRIN